MMKLTKIKRDFDNFCHSHQLVQRKRLSICQYQSKESASAPPMIMGAAWEGPGRGLGEAPVQSLPSPYRILSRKLHKDLLNELQKARSE